MRLISSIAISTILITAAAQAAQIYRFSYGFSKPGASYADFRTDRAACLAQSRKARLFTVVHAMHEIDSYDVVQFRQCMTGNGYVPDQAGFNTVFRGLGEPRAGEYVDLVK